MEGEGVPTPSIAAAPPSSPADHPDLSLVGSPEGNDRYFDQFLQSSHENDLPQSDTVALNDDLRARISIATAPPSSPPDHPDFSPVGSPEGNDRYFDQFLQSSHENDMPQSDTVSLNDDLRARIIKQAEYYFSDENLATDKFLMNYITKNRERFVPIGVIASFRKMKKLSKDASIIVAALKESSLLVVSSDGKKVKRANPLPITEVKDPQLCTVLVENLPEDHSVDNIRQIFGKAGDIKNISIRDAHAAKESRKCTVAEKLLSGKLHALVEYETVESAEKAVATLNDEQDWRYGMRVKLLKRAGKHGQRNKGWEFDSEKNSSVQPSDPADEGEKPPPNEHQDDMPDEEVVSSDGKKVKRANPLPITEVKDPQLCTVLVENLPEDHSVDNIRQIFGKAGDIKNISIRDAHAAKESRKCTVAEKLLSGKLHALVEYETVESAEKAVATLNDEQDWRYGMRVKLLKRAGKHGQRNKGWEFDSEKNSSVQPSDPADEGEKPPPNEHQDDMPDEEDGEHLSKEKNGNRNRNRGRGRRQKHHANNGQVVGHVTTVSSGHGVEISKPPPGPRMPDGTRGFAMGRGKPPASSNQR